MGLWSFLVELNKLYAMKKILAITLLACCQQAIAQCDVTLTASDYNGVGVSCYGECDGFVFAELVGSPPFLYNWSSGDLTQDLEYVCSGLYVLTITDNLGCIAVDSIEVSEPPEFVSEIFITNPLSAVGACDGELAWHASGGTPMSSWPWYGYSWIDCTTGVPYGIQSSPLDNVCAGEYGLAIVDANDCKDTSCIIIEMDTCAYVSVNYSLGGLDCYWGVYGAGFTIDSYQWVNCDDMYSPFIGDTLDYYSSSYGGNVAVIISALGCMDTSYCEDMCSWGIDELNMNSKKVVRIIDLIGNDIPDEPNTLLIYIYDDGTTKKVLRVE